MKLLRIIPFALAPLFVQNVSTDSLNAQTPKPIPSKSSPKPLPSKNPGDLFNNLFKLPPLTDQENKALNELENFLTKYTGNGKLNFGTIDRLIQGLIHDYDAVNQEGQGMRGLKGFAARRYPYNRSRIVYNKIQNEVANRAYAELSNKLFNMGIDPNTACNPDNAEIKHLVTRRELEKLETIMPVLEKLEKKYLPPNKKLVFRQGPSVEGVRFIRSRSIGIPPGAEIVDRKKS